MSRALLVPMKLFAVACIMLILASCAGRRDTGADSRVKNLVESRNFKFEAQFATPMGGRQIQLTGPYELVVSENSISSHLPYYGIAYRAPIGPDESGVKFTSGDFKYTVAPRKSGWNIQIKPNDQQDVRALSLRVTASGVATLQVTSNYRQAISYSGRIVPVNEKTW
ncbi:MAG TPA: DUF4251 domain-containing protein [Sphingobacteriaceae bacterium]